MTAREIIDIYISFFEKRGHTRIPNSPLVPENDPTTLFTSSGMQPLVPYLLGEPHPAGTRLVDVQNSFRAQDIEEVGDNRHTTFFRMLGNWSLGDYFKKEQLPWFFELLTKELGLNPKKLYVTVFEGNHDVEADNESVTIWTKIFDEAGLNPKERIFYYGVTKNWWSRSGTPDKMPVGEPGGPDSEVFYDFGKELKIHENSEFSSEKCHVNCDCGRFLEIGNSVFMQYRKQADGTLTLLPKPNVDFGGGLERLLAAIDDTPDIFKTSLFSPIITALEKITEKKYETYARHMRIVADHLIAATCIAANNVMPSNKEQGYILRRLIRRGLDHFYELKETDITPVLDIIVYQYGQTDPILEEKYEFIKNVLLTEEQAYKDTRNRAKKYIEKKYEGKHKGDELMGQKEITAEDAFILYSTHGLSPTQIKSLGYAFDDRDFANRMRVHKDLSKTASAGKFKGGLADTQELTIKGHTATHLLHKALRDMLGVKIHQTGSNITTERLRFDFNFDRKLTEEEIEEIEHTVREKITEDLPVHFEIMPLKKAKELGAIGLFDEKYQNDVKVYFIGGSNPHSNSLPKGERDQGNVYSMEFCGGPHVPHTGVITSFKITKQEKLGQGQMRLYAVVQ